MKARGQWFRYIALGLYIPVLVIMPTLVLRTNHTEAAQLQRRTLHISNALAGAANVEYELSFSDQTSGLVGSVRLQLCSNDPFPGMPCTAPAGLDLSDAALSYQSGMTGFIIHANTTANELILTRTSGAATSGISRYRLSGVDNPSAAGTVYGRIETFATSDASGVAHDDGGLATAIIAGNISFHSEVPPYLTFCIGQTITGYDCSTAVGSYIDFGELSMNKTATGQTKLLIATNADYGYTIRVQGTTLTSGINVIPAISTRDVSRQGTGQFGMNLRANTTPSAGQEPTGSGVGQAATDYNVPNQYKFISGDVVAEHNHPDNLRMYTATYVVNVPKSQSPGVYVTTLTYIALATF